MENNNKKSKALIIAIIIFLVLVASLFVIYKKRDSFGVKTSSNIAKIFSPLVTTDNRKKETIQAGEDIKKGDAVVAIGTDGKRTIVRKAGYEDRIMGYADEDILFGDNGDIVLYDGSGAFGGGDIDGGGAFGGGDIDGGGAFGGGDIDGGGTFGGGTGDAVCSDGIDNDGDGKVDNNDPNCHLDGDLEKAYLPDHYSESVSFLEDTEGQGPDLVAGRVSPTTSTVNSEVLLSATITNVGNLDVTQSLLSFFTITENKNKLQSEKDKDIELSVVTPALSSKMGDSAQIKYTFKKEGVFYIRACADKKFATDPGAILELNEDNNCGEWTTFTVTNSLPTDGSKPACSDGVDNDGDDLTDEQDPQCHRWGILSGEYLPDYNSESETSFECNDTIDNDEDGLIDAKDPVCHVGGDLKNAYTPKYNSESTSSAECNDTADNDGDGLIDEKDPACYSGGSLNSEYLPFHDSEKDAPALPNVCLDVEQYPLTFTEQEKVALADLLRKFYLISPTLKTEDDIGLLYEDIIDQQNFSEQLTVLINECYAQTSDPTYTGPKAMYGNPWFKYNTRGSFLVDTKNTSSYCWFDPKSTRMFYDPRSCAKITNQFDCENHANKGWFNVVNYTKTGCTWVETTNLEDYETILNIW